jgi:organic radical activating enzyme
MSADSGRNYYCSQKFKSIKIDLAAMTTLNCHAAVTYPVDFKWLADNPGQLFNTPQNVAERKMMLLNQRNPGCEQNCWPAEDRGAISPRIYTDGIEKTHTQVVARPENIDINIGADCNLTCSYCCKEYSTAWQRDIATHGNYSIDNLSDRYQLTTKNQILSRLSQPEIKSSERYQLLLNEIKLAAPTLKKLTVTGGEPLLDNHLFSTLLDLNLPSTTVVMIYTGLGVSKSRFSRMVEKLKLIPGLILNVSAESIGDNLEFNRYGNKWVEVQDKLKILKNNGIKVMFHSTLSNLTLMGFSEFYHYFSKNYLIHVSFVCHPSMMSVHVLDPETKLQINDALENLPFSVSSTIIESMQATPTAEEKLQLTQFLTQYLQRRPDLSINIYPESFINWLGIKNVV